MANSWRRTNAWWGPCAALGVLLAGWLPLAASAQPVTTIPHLDEMSRAKAADAGTVQTEVDLQRTDGGFALEGASAPDAGAQPRFEPPTLVADSPASYPEALAAQPVGGSVQLELLVDEQGEMAEARLVRGLHPLLDDAALHAATGLRFTPAKVDGTPVSVRLNFEYRFEAPQPVAAEQPVTLRGLVRTKGNRRPVPGATIVSVAAQDVPVETGAEGRFEARLPSGKQRVRVTAPGHKPGEFEEDVRAGETLEVVYGLEPLVVNPYETVVRGDRERTEVSRITLRDAELREIPGTMGDPFRVVMLMPGVGSMLSGISYPVVRGSQPAATGYFLDGIRVPILFHLFLGPAVIHPDFIDTIDFFAGNPPTQYGRLMGGAVEGKLTSPRDDRFHGSAYADFINAGLFVEYPFQSTGTNVSLAGRISYTPWLIALGANALAAGALNDSRVVLDFYDYQARVEQKVGSGRLRLFAFGSSDTFGAEATSDEGFTALQSVLFHRVDLRYRHPLAGGELEVGTNVGLDRFGIVSASPRDGGGVINIDQRNATARLGYQRKFGEDLTLRSGLDVDHKRARINIQQSVRPSPEAPLEEFSLDTPMAIATFSGLWAELQWMKDSLWTVVPGVRLDNYHLSGGPNALVVEPRVSVRRKMSEQLTLKGGVGLYHQAPTTLISLPIVDISALELGLQRTLQVSAGVEYKDLWGFDVSLDGYVNPMLRTVELSPFGSEDDPFVIPPLEGPGGERSSPSPQPRTGGRRVVRGMQLLEDPRDPLPGIDLGSESSRGLAYGLEVLIRRQLGGNWFGWLSYSLQRSTRRVTFNRYDSHDQPVGKAEGDLPYVFDQTHVANLVLNYKFSNNITVGGVLHFNSGRPESGNLTSRTQVEGTDADGQPRWVRVDLDKVDRLPPFFRFDLRLSKAWAYETFSLEAYLDMLNVTISKEVVAFNYAGGYGLPLEKTTTGVPIPLPILGLKARY